jgi:hypothetical protein
VFTPGLRLPLVDAGINPIAAVRAPEGLRHPAIIISSSPHKIGSHETPWQDTFDVDNGFVRYFGDNKSPDRDPASARGNALLLRQFDLHTSAEHSKRQNSVPLILFRRVSRRGKVKGNLEFQGLAVLTRAERVTQPHLKHNDYFANYVFDFAVLTLAKEAEALDWEWIGARRDATQALSQTTRLAPFAWREWLQGGPELVERYRRRVSKLRVVERSEQRTIQGSSEEKTLQAIYEFYSKRKSRFEALASRVTHEILTENGASCREGWITPPSSDGGSDFVGRLDLGRGFAQVKLIVLGQAKCEQPATPTGGNHIARTVARLRRGWVGVYVTTSHFSESVQREIIEDQYPIILVHGLELARTVLLLANKKGSSVRDFLLELDSRYESLVRNRRPEEILLD